MVNHIGLHVFSVHIPVESILVVAIKVEPSKQLAEVLTATDHVEILELSYELADHGVEGLGDISRLGVDVLGSLTLLHPVHEVQVGLYNPYYGEEILSHVRVGQESVQIDRLEVGVDALTQLFELLQCTKIIFQFWPSDL